MKMCGIIKNVFSSVSHRLLDFKLAYLDGCHTKLTNGLTTKIYATANKHVEKEVVLFKKQFGTTPLLRNFGWPNQTCGDPYKHSIYVVVVKLGAEKVTFLFVDWTIFFVKRAFKEYPSINVLRSASAVQFRDRIYKMHEKQADILMSSINEKQKPDITALIKL